MRTTPTHDLEGVPVPDRPIGTVRPRAPRITKLGTAECKVILARNHVGRLAYTFRDSVDIVPLHYAYEDGWLYGRTSPGEKLTKLRHHCWVAFEVDEVDDWFEWRSVVVHGALYLVPGGSASEVADHAVEVLRRFMPQTFSGDDPAPFRTMLFRIHIDSMTGRRATVAKR